MTFFTVCFGKDQKLKFNSNVRVRVLLDKLREACNFMECDVVDLANPKY